MSINFNQSCTSCISQILNINDYAFNDISSLKLFDDCGNEYDLSKFEFSYSLDNVCWTCYMKYDEFMNVIVDLRQDFYLRIRLSGIVSKIEIDNENFTSYSTTIDSSLTLSSDNQSSNLYNPYINMDCALSLYQQLTEMVSNVTGIGCYYFKLAPSAKSKDITFKEYTLMDVSAVKQVKLIIADNQMPSSKPEFSDWGLDFSTDWEVELSKSSFATAFGNTAKPMEGDLVYIPMMKRMWMVNGAWEEKKDVFMWTSTTFKLTLVKYQEKDSVDLGESEALVNSFVKNKYEDLFGDNTSNNAEFESVNNDNGYIGKLYNIYEADAIRKALNIDQMEINENSLYHKGTLISDMQYVFNGLSMCKQIEYQYKFCGDNGSMAFIFTSQPNIIKYDFIVIGNLVIKISQKENKVVLYNENSQAKLVLENNKTYFVYLRWSKQLNIVEFGAAQYTYNESIPLYKLQPSQYYFDFDNSIKSIKKYNIEMAVAEKSQITINNFKGTFTNFKIFNSYVNELTELLQMYPTHNNLIVNDTARKIVSSLTGGQI